MSENKDKLSNNSDQNNLIQSLKEIVYGLTPILAKTVDEGGSLHITVPGNHAKAINQTSQLEIPEIEESKYSTELDEIFTQLHDADRHIAETRKNTMRLGIETKSMLDDLRKQLG